MQNNGIETTLGVWKFPLSIIISLHTTTVKATETVQRSRVWWEHPLVWGTGQHLVRRAQEVGRLCKGIKGPWNTDRYSGAGVTAAKGRGLARDWEARESDRKWHRGGTGQERTRDKITHARGRKMQRQDKWLQSTSTASGQGVSSKQDDVMTREKMQYNILLRLETGGCQNEAKWPAATKIALGDTGVKKWTALAEQESIQKSVKSWPEETVPGYYYVSFNTALQSRCSLARAYCQVGTRNEWINC